MTNPIQDAKYIWHKDLEKIIEEGLGKYYDIQNGEHGQNTILTFHTDDGPLWTDEPLIEDWVSGNVDEDANCQVPSLSAIGHELMAWGLIPEGFYVVHIWW